MARGRTRKSSAKGTKRLKRSSFAYPKSRAYPINTRKRARSALARAANPRNRGSYATVAKAVKRKYPSMKLKGRKKK